jgi:signal transduction histidine kinase
MKSVRRSAVTLSVAAFVPLLLLALFYMAFQFQELNREVEYKTLGPAGAYVARLDAKLAADLGALSVLAGAPLLRSDEPEDGRMRAMTAMADFPHWKNIILTDASTREELWQTAVLTMGRAPARPYVLDFAARKAISEIGGIAEAKRGCACIPINRRLAGSSYILTVERDVSDLQELLRAETAPGETAALVDREGLFIARTIEQDSRVGTPSTEYVRKAVSQGGSGIYSGVTFEGLHNRTAYVTSELSKWSAHIAVADKSHNLLSAGHTTFLILAVITSLCFAGALTSYGIRDLKRRGREERAQMQSHKLEAIGTLSSAVAHDFNNLLTIMTACLRILGKSDDPLKKEQAIREGLSAAERSAKLVHQLLTFARDKPLELSCVDLSATIDGIRDLLSRSLGSGITFDVNISPDAQHVQTNAAQLELVLINLAVNARDAMPGGGTFSITSKTASATGCVDLMVKDTGIGMSAEVATRALEPFFTTKPEGKGTGLGLAQAHMLAKDSKGSLHLETALGKGTLFTFSLSACEL